MDDFAEDSINTKKRRSIACASVSQNCSHTMSREAGQRDPPGLRSPVSRSTCDVVPMIRSGEDEIDCPALELAARALRCCTVRPARTRPDSQGSEGWGRDRSKPTSLLFINVLMISPTACPTIGFAGLGGRTVSNGDCWLSSYVMSAERHGGYSSNPQLAANLAYRAGNFSCRVARRQEIVSLLDR